MVSAPIAKKPLKTEKEEIIERPRHGSVLDGISLFTDQAEQGSIVFVK